MYSPNFNSLMLGEKLGAIVHKYPDSNETLGVEYISGKRLEIFKYIFDQIVKKARKVDGANIDQVYSINTKN